MKSWNSLKVKTSAMQKTIKRMRKQVTDCEKM